MMCAASTLRKQTGLEMCLPKAFTLFELLAVIGIGVLLAAMSLPAFSRVRERAQTAKCGQNLRTLAAAFHMYSAEHDGDLPYNTYSGAPPGALWWHQEISPYVGFDWDKNLGPQNWFTKEERLAGIFHCPADIWWGKTYAVDPSYGCNVRLTKAIPPQPLDTPRTKRVSVTRPSEMLLLADAGHVEEDGDAAWRIGPVQPGQAPLARHDGFGNVAWLDGHVTMEGAARLEELHKEPYPYKHWGVSP